MRLNSASFVRFCPASKCIRRVRSGIDDFVVECDAVLFEAVASKVREIDDRKRQGETYMSSFASAMHSLSPEAIASVLPLRELKKRCTKEKVFKSFKKTKRAPYFCLVQGCTSTNRRFQVCHLYATNGLKAGLSAVSHSESSPQWASTRSPLDIMRTRKCLNQ